MIMKQAKYNPTKSFMRLATEEVPVRRRNLSLGNNPENTLEDASSLSPTLVKQAPEVLYTSRKKRNLVKAIKFKSVKFSTLNTKLCHQNIQQYNLLKRKMTQKTNQQTNNQSSKRLILNPKLSIKNLGIAVQHQFISKNKSLVERRHVDTEPSRTSQSRKHSKEDLNPIKMPVFLKKHQQRHSAEFPTKRYNQLTLREIAQVQQTPKFNILMKLRELKKKDAPKRLSRKPSEDYSLQGW